MYRFHSPSNDCTNSDESLSLDHQTACYEIFSPYESPKQQPAMMPPNHKNISYIEKDLIFINEDTQSQQTFKRQQIAITLENEFSFNNLIESLKILVPELQGSNLYIWDDLRANFQSMGQDPLVFNIHIPVNNFRNSDCIFIKYKPSDFSQPDFFFLQQQQSQLLQPLEDNNSETLNNNNVVNIEQQQLQQQQSQSQPQQQEVKPKKKKQMKKEKRIKERQIGDVQSKVAEWRKLHEEGEKLNLDQAALRVGISRKTLDDYSLQMRRADSLGFDFEKHKESKMGVLRKFVKDRQNELKRKESLSLPSGEDVQSSEVRTYVDIDLFINTTNEDGCQMQESDLDSIVQQF